METRHYENGDICLTYNIAGEGELIHLAHANGFSSGVYKPIFDDLRKDFTIAGMNICGQCHCSANKCDGKKMLKSWHALAHELGDLIAAVSGGKRIVAAGHSIGGIATMLCAVERPELFKKIILLDPVLVDLKSIRLFRLAKLFGMMNNSPLAVRARKRKNGWDSREEAVEYFRARPLFAGWADESLQAYGEYGLFENSEGRFELSCPPEVEARGFSTYPTSVWNRLRKLRVPVLLVRGGSSDTFSTASRDLFLKILPGADYLELDGLGHLFPMQAPQRTASIIRNYTLGKKFDFR
mgnify:CR=1 FL=1